MSDFDQCQHLKDDGGQCGVPNNLNPETGLCIWHDPTREDEARRMRSKGGRTVHRDGENLEPDELPPLVDHEAAEAWTDAVGRAAATGRLGPAAANATLRAVKEWREAHASGQVSDRLERLEAALAEWRRTGDPEPVLELVEGGKA